MIVGRSSDTLRSTTLATATCSGRSTPLLRPWAELLARTFAVDVLDRSKCNGRIRSPLYYLRSRAFVTMAGCCRHPGNGCNTRISILFFSATSPVDLPSAFFCITGFYRCCALIDRRSATTSSADARCGATAYLLCASLFSGDYRRLGDRRITRFGDIFRLYHWAYLVLALLILLIPLVIENR